jgi:uncharacterized protein (DUF58 family)
VAGLLRVRPSRLLLGWLALLVLLGAWLGWKKAAGAVLPQVTDLALWCTLLGTGILALIDLALVSRLPRVSVRRQLPAVLMQGTRAQASLTLEYDQQGSLGVTVYDPVPPGLGPQPAAQVLELNHGRGAQWHYPIQGNLGGRHLFSHCELQVASLLGLWRIRRELHLPDELRVCPAYRNLLPAHLARRSNPPCDMPLLLVLDSGQAQAGPGTSTTLHDAESGICLQLASAALSQGEAVGLLTMGAETLCYVAPRKGREHIATLAKTFDQWPGCSTGVSSRDLAQALLSRQRRQARVLWISRMPTAAPDTLLKVCQAVDRRHWLSLICLADPALASQRRQPLHNEQDATIYAALISQENARQAQLAQLRAQGITVMEVDPTVYTSVVDAYCAWTAEFTPRRSRG